jgi:hypothetical protein
MPEKRELTTAAKTRGQAHAGGGSGREEAKGRWTQGGAGSVRVMKAGGAGSVDGPLKVSRKGAGEVEAEG